MHAYPNNQGFVVRLDPGEEVVATLTAFFKEHNIAGASITGIGAVEKTTLGYFDLHNKVYEQREFPGEMELLSLVGNLTHVDGEPLLHAHVQLGDAGYGVVGGHLFSGTIAVTGEIFVQVTDTAIHRAPDARSGLNLMADPEA